MVTEIQLWLEDNLKSVQMDNERFYEISLLLEPREREDEKVARLLQETGFF